MSNNARKLRKRALAERFDVCTRTVDRWLRDGILPRPTIINGLYYWDLADIERCEADLKAATAAA